jgi:quercetin dioxygenase-like cupin family protein
MKKPSVKNSDIQHIKPVFEDHRGTIADLVEGKNLQHVGLIVSKKGAVRGNHYHKKATQYAYILKGKVEYYRKDLRVESAPVEKFILGAGSLMIEPPRVVHAIVALEDTEFLDMTDVSREDKAYDSDTFRIQITPESGKK